VLEGEKTLADYIAAELRQIYEAQTIERARYYLERLIKGLSETKTSAVNDINLNRWKEYDEILTDSLWVIDKRDSSGAHNAGYWGNFIPQIPHQLLLRYTRKGDWVLDTFLGSGTTLIECRRLGRNGIGIELLPEVAALAAANTSRENDPQPRRNGGGDRDGGLPGGGFRRAAGQIRAESLPVRDHAPALLGHYQVQRRRPRPLQRQRPRRLPGEDEPPRGEGVRGARGGQVLRAGDRRQVQRR